MDDNKTSADTAAITAITALEAELRAAMLASDVAALERLLDDDLVFTTPDGRVLTKQEDLTVHRDGQLHLKQLDFFDTQIRRIDTLYLTTTKATLAGQYGTMTFDGTFAYTRLWRPHGATWRVIAGQAAKIG
ncbi:nuclear transport factor 2 family protein [Pandoraea sp. PE-S2R-1]|uniref:nuclear transport factor 2 family protein n=1 Tax=Pandoraea sp. PE-S2R-1 TaxID=1986994 RepID=UPI000B3F88FE|nr:nuclear transport factor 2 family protein [Pandoraea sp. PE-S2R-1]